ncbi:hypothetical protein SSS_01930 [Sarcoptes scabiei]|nr:hypothetical protein SSS_01930 [Sarcoptes scabiei]
MKAIDFCAKNLPLLIALSLILSAFSLLVIHTLRVRSVSKHPVRLKFTRFNDFSRKPPEASYFTWFLCLNGHLIFIFSIYRYRLSKRLVNSIEIPSRISLDQIDCDDILELRNRKKLCKPSLSLCTGVASSSLMIFVGAFRSSELNYITIIQNVWSMFLYTQLLLDMVFEIRINLLISNDHKLIALIQISIFILSLTNFLIHLYGSYQVFLANFILMKIPRELFVIDAYTVVAITEWIAILLTAGYFLTFLKLFHENIVISDQSP